MNYDILTIIALSLLLLVSTFISTKGKLIDNRKEGLNVLTNNGRRLIIVNIIILFLLVGQYLLNIIKLILKILNIIENKKKEMHF